MLKKSLMIAAVAVGLAMTLSTIDTQAAPATTCSGIYANGKKACARNGRAECPRVMQARYQSCMATGCWRGEKRNSCNVTRR